MKNRDIFSAQAGSCQKLVDRVDMCFWFQCHSSAEYKYIYICENEKELIERMCRMVAVHAILRSPYVVTINLCWGMIATLLGMWWTTRTRVRWRSIPSFTILC
jgi:hypothetical protein